VVVLDGCFRVSDAHMAGFLSHLHNLRQVALKNSLKIGKLTAVAIAAMPRGSSDGAPTLDAAQD
jgi:hypothetical protein